VGCYGNLLLETFISDVRGCDNDKLMEKGGTFHDSTIRLMMAVWSRSPAAAKAYRHHWLHRVPSNQTLQTKASAGVGIQAGMPQGKIVRLVREIYVKTVEEEKMRLGSDFKPIPDEWQV